MDLSSPSGGPPAGPSGGPPAGPSAGPPAGPLLECLVRRLGGLDRGWVPEALIACRLGLGCLRSDPSPQPLPCSRSRARRLHAGYPAGSVRLSSPSARSSTNAFGVPSRRRVAVGSCGESTSHATLWGVDLACRCSPQRRRPHAGALPWRRGSRNAIQVGPEQHGLALSSAAAPRSSLRLRAHQPGARDHREARR